MKARNRLVLGYSVAFFIGPIISKLMAQGNKNTNSRADIHYDVNNNSKSFHPTANVDSNASIKGTVETGREVYIGAFTSIRCDNGLKIYIGDQSNIQDGVILQALQNFTTGSNLIEDSILEHIKPYSVYIGERVSLAQQCQVLGPCRIGSDVFIGMQSFVFKSIIGDGAIIEPTAKVIDVVIPNNRYVPAGKVISTQDDADALPEVTPAHKYFNFNKKLIEFNTETIRKNNNAKQFESQSM